MVLRCSLLGHDYDEPQVEREREERGSEVVLTVEEYEECTRCGERNVISENTEVTTLTESDSAADRDDGAPDPAVGTDGATPPAAESDEVDPADADDAATPAADPDEVGPETPESNGFADGELPTTEDGDPIVDDGEILEEGDEPTDREYGQWPDAEDTGPPAGGDEPAAWPDADAEAADAGSESTDADAETAADTDTGADADAEFVDAGADAASADEYTYSEAEVDESAEDDAVVIEDGPSTADVGGTDEVATEADIASVTDDRSAPETGFESAGSAPAPGESAPPEGVPTEFYCPRCSFVAPGDRGSLRPGDICPDCRKGYLGERER